MDTKQLITGSPKEGFYPIVQDTVTVIELNEAVMNLTSESSSEDIAAAFDSVEGFNDLIENVRNSENIVNGILMNNDNAIGKIICTIAAYKNQYACDIEYIYNNKIIRLDITNTDGTMSCIRKETELGGGSQNNIKYISLNNIPDGTGTVNEDIITTLNTLQDRDILIGILDESKVAVVINYYMVNSKFYGYCVLPNWANAESIVINSLIINLNTKESSWNGVSIDTNGNGTKFLSDDGKYKTIEVGDKTNVLILSLENDLANGQKDSPVEAEVSTALKDAISTGKACVIKSANSDILANLQQISDNVTIVMEQISRVGQTFVAVNTTITVNTATNVISDYQTGALVLETEGDGSKFLSNDGSYKEIQQIKGGNTTIGLDKTSVSYPGIVLGEFSKASGETSIAGGSGSIASANFSTAIGKKCVASGNYGVALGYKTIAKKTGSIALGYNCIASGNEAVSIGGNAANIYLVSAEGTNRYYVNGGTNFDNPTYDINRIQVGVEIISKIDGRNFFTTVTKVELIDNVIYIETADSLGTFDTPTVCGIGFNCAIGEISFSANVSCAVGRESAAFAFGYAGGDYSFSAGDYTYAYGECSSTFGRLTESWNDFEFSVGLANKSTQNSDESIATRFTVGIGSGTNYENAVRKNAVEIKANGDGYIIGVGNYDGTNAEDEGTKTIQEVLNGVVTTDKVLTKDNTTEFTPTADYQPATKKYVDDKTNIANIIEVDVSSILSGGSIKFSLPDVNHPYYLLCLIGLNDAGGDYYLPLMRYDTIEFKNYGYDGIIASNTKNDQYYKHNNIYRINISTGAGSTEATLEISKYINILTESEYTDLGTAPETDNSLYFITPD